MKQSGIASFFGKPHGKGEAKAVAVEGEEPKQRQVLGDGNRGEKRSTEARKPGHASGGRLKRLKKSGSKTRDENREVRCFPATSREGTATPTKGPADSTMAMSCLQPLSRHRRPCIYGSSV